MIFTDQQIFTTPDETVNNPTQSVDGMISNTLRDVKELNVLIKTKSKELKERLGLHTGFASITEEYKEVAKQRRTIKLQAIAENEALTRLEAEVKSLRQEKKERENALSDYLIEYEAQTHQMSFLDDSGQVIEFEKVARLRIKE